MPTYRCAICDNTCDQKSHHTSHIKTKKHKDAKRIFELELSQLSKEELIAKYKSNLISHILACQETIIVEVDDASSVTSECDLANEIIEVDALTISNKEALREHIHKIHNYLRNNGAGYGMNALKVFNILYGLKKLEDSELFDIFELNPNCKFSVLLELAKANDGEKINELITNDILDELHKHKSNFKRMLFYEIPRDIYAKMYPQLIKEIERISLIEQSCGEHLSGKIYEYFIGRDETAISELGAYFTNRHIVNYIMQKLSPQVKEDGTIHDMIDMFAGSGGFTTGYINYLNEHGELNVNWETEKNKIYHFDMNEDVIKSAGLEIMCLTRQVPDMEQNVLYKNSFTDSFDNKKFHYVLTNPPYGGDKTNKSEEIVKLEKIRDHIKALLPTIADEDVRVRREKQFKENERKIKKNKKEVDESKVSLDKCSDRIKQFAKKYGLKSNDKEGCSLILMMDMVAPNGTVIGVLKEGVFFNKTYKDIRKCLIENFNVREVISVPQDQFENTTTKTSIIIFDNTEEKTSEVRFSELIINTVPEDTFEEVQGQIVLTANKGDIIDVEDALISQASKDELLENAICSLNGKDYGKKEIICGEGYELVRLGDVCKLENGSQLDKKNIITGIYPVYGGGTTPVGFHNEYNNENATIISGTGNCGFVQFNKNKFWASQSFTIKSHNEIFNNYVFIICKLMQPIIMSTCSGSVQKFIRASQFKDFKIPIPKSKAKIQEWVDRISAPYNEKNEKQRRIKELELFVQNRIKDIGENEECDEVELGSVCDLKDGYDFYRNEMDDRQKYIEGENLPLLKIGSDDISDYIKINVKYNNVLVKRNDIVIGTKGTCGKVRKVIIEKGYHKHGLLKIIDFKINKEYLYYYLNYILDEKMIEKMSNKSVLSNMKKENLMKLKIRIPKNKKLIDELEPTFQQIEQLQNEVKIAEDLFNQYIKELSEEALPSS